MVFLAAVIAWLATRPPRREKVVVALAVAVVAGALGVRWFADRDARSSRAEWIDEARDDYAGLWGRLREESRAAASSLGAPPRTLAERLAAFRRLSALEREGGSGRRSLLLLDPDGGAVAWAGAGLLHETPPDDVPRQGMLYQASFSAVTLLAVEPLPTDAASRRPWRVVAGASFPTDRLPFPGLPRRVRWSLVDRPEQALPGMLLVPLRDAPTMVVEPSFAQAPPFPWTGQVVWGAIAFAFLALAVMRGGVLGMTGTAGLEPFERRVWTSTLVLAGAFAAGLAAGLPWHGIAALLLGLALALIGWTVLSRTEEPERPVSRWDPREWGRGRPGGEARAAAIGGAVSALLLFLAAWGYQRLGPPVDLASGIVATAEAFGLRLALAAAAFGLLALAGSGRRPDPPARDRWAWLGSLVLLLAGSLCDHPALALPLLAAGGAAAALFVDRRRMAEGLAPAALALLAILVAADAGETGYRLRLREWAETDLLTRLTPPSLEQMGALAREIKTGFTTRDLSELVPRSAEGLQRQDLAFALWRSSPLARPYALSALVIKPREGAPATFSFGVPLTQQENVDWSPERWQEMSLPLWEESAITGEAELRLAGKPWGVARFWLMPRPGFELRDQRRLGEVEVGLLRGGPAADPVQDLIDPALYALYDESGRPSFSPWEATPQLSERLRGKEGGTTVGVVDTPSGFARAFSHMTLGVWEVIYLPFLTPLAALERVANSAAGLLIFLGLAAPPVLLLSLPRASFRDLLWRVVRSYSKRLMIVYTVLLALPLLLLNTVLFRSMEDRLGRQQRAAGEAALSSAQQVLGERLLTLEPGFGVDTALGDRLLRDLAEIVHHEVNLYWGSSIYASSKHELFAAGLLPNRIPGEIYSRLALLGHGLATRTNFVGNTAYLEMYAPLRVPGMPSGEERLFLSMPLLAQQEEAAREMASLRRHGILVTVALFVLLVAVGTRLARSFTRPLMQLIEGTRRIAAGATSLDLAPSELELAALVQAIDDMALRIAHARERLVREKQVVERMVESITSGVVSLDHDHRVLMHNRVAAELLGVRVGESLDEAMAGQEKLAPVSEFLTRVAQRETEMARETVHLSLGGDGEREWSLVWVPVPGAGEPSALLVVEDATEVLRGQRLLAWAEMARLIAHEIKNPLTPIRLSTEHMQEVYRSAPEQFGRVFDRCTSNILTQVEELRSIASDFSTYSAIPRIDPRPGDLTATISELVEGYRAAPPEGVSVELQTDGPIPARFDARLLQRAVRNLLENALRASAGGGKVTVRVERNDGTARIVVLDEGPGVRPAENLPRIFDPYFSTHDTGTGLGLPIARRVIEEHGGSIVARNRREKGLEVAITLPVQEGAEGA